MKSVYASTVFLSAYLLFQVELITGKELLPWFGGAPAVWTTCLVFFQVVLLAGYAYAHMVASRLGLRRQAALHALLLALSLIMLGVLAVRWPTPITPGPSWKPVGGAEPVGELVVLLAVSVCVPFFVLSTTGPILQNWYMISRPGKSPYRLYAVSNAGSLIGLVAYPFLVEPFLELRTQALVWSALYVVFALGVLAGARELGKIGAAGNYDAPARPQASPGARPAPPDVLLWGGLAAVASALLLATTNHMCQDTAVIPLLWVLPLSLYLATFILCFRFEGLYRRWLFPPLFCIALAYCLWVLSGGLKSSLPSQIVADAVVLFAGCMMCNGELGRAKPEAAHLTVFYLAIAAGGALGGLGVAVAAPRLFDGFWEFQISLVGTGALFLAALNRDRSSFLHRKRALILPALVALLLAFGGALIWQAVVPGEKAVFATRNFYGVLRVVNDKNEHLVRLLHGRITHGFQYTDSARSRIPTSYYSRESGIGLAIANHPHRDAGLRIGVVGMGTGTLAAYGRANDTLRFYEINPAVPRLSAGGAPYFTYLSGCAGRVEIAMGDARLSLERELERGENQRFDILALDAFSSDAIPVHLLTEEAFGLYLRHLRGPAGMLAVHISNRYLDLIPVVHGYAERHGLRSVFISNDEDEEGAWFSDWILISPEPAPWGTSAIADAATPWDSTSYRVVRPWTDEYSNLISVLRPPQNAP